MTTTPVALAVPLRKTIDSNDYPCIYDANGNEIGYCTNPHVTDAIVAACNSFYASNAEAGALTEADKHLIAELAMLRQSSGWSRAYEVAEEIESALRSLASVRAERDELRDYRDRLPADWFTDSSLQTWFPITNENIERVTAERDALRAEVAQLREALLGEAEALDAMSELAADNAKNLKARARALRAASPKAAP